MLNILLIEDSDDDAFLFERALTGDGISSCLRRVCNGAEAVSYLEEGGNGNGNGSPFPGVLFTDIKMPKMDGFELLKWLKADPRCSLLPVMVFSASNHHTDVEKAYRLGANAYLVKPSSMDELRTAVRAAHGFWSRCAKAEYQMRTRV